MSNPPLPMSVCDRCGQTKTRAEMVVSKYGRVTPTCKACSVPPPGLSWCATCHRWEPLENFGTNKSRPDGISAICRAQKKRMYDSRPKYARLAREPREVVKHKGPEPSGIAPNNDLWERYRR